MSIEYCPSRSPVTELFKQFVTNIILTVGCFDSDFKFIKLKYIKTLTILFMYYEL